MTEPTLITEPGIHTMPADVYHADPVMAGSLSSSGARLLLDTCPAVYRWRADHPEQAEHKPEFDLGHAAHKLVLGAGPEFAVIDAKDWRTIPAKDARTAAYEAGKVPLLRKDYAQVIAMADAIRAHPLAGALLDPAHGRAEQALFWIDPEFGVWRRAMLDWLPTAGRGWGRILVADYKTTSSAEPSYLARAVHNYGYHMQAAYYLDGVAALLGESDAAFVFIAQEKTPPYLVTVFDLDTDALAYGHERNRVALETFATCQMTDMWPGYASDVVRLSLPPWATRTPSEVTW